MGRTHSADELIQVFFELIQRYPPHITHVPLYNLHETIDQGLLQPPPHLIGLSPEDVQRVSTYIYQTWRQFPMPEFPVSDTNWVYTEPLDIGSRWYHRYRDTQDCTMSIAYHSVLLSGWKRLHAICTEHPEVFPQLQLSGETNQPIMSLLQFVDELIQSNPALRQESDGLSSSTPGYMGISQWITAQFLQTILELTKSSNAAPSTTDTSGAISANEVILSLPSLSPIEEVHQLIALMYSSRLPEFIKEVLNHPLTETSSKTTMECLLEYQWYLNRAKSKSGNEEDDNKGKAIEAPAAALLVSSQSGEGCCEEEDEGVGLCGLFGDTI